MRKLTANYVYTDKGLLKYGIIHISDNGKISIEDTGGTIRETEGLEFHSGLLITEKITNSQIKEFISREKYDLNIILKELNRSNDSKGISVLSFIDYDNTQITTQTSSVILL